MTTPFPIQNSDYYQHWLEERKEIEKHKWVLSERAGKDVGWEYAQWNWLWQHRADWLATRDHQQSGAQIQH